MECCKGRVKEEPKKGNEDALEGGRGRQWEVQEEV